MRPASSTGTAPDNFSYWMQNWNYPVTTSSKSSTTWTNVNSVQRASLLGYGRPFIRMAPTLNIFSNTFADKTNDSRYDGTLLTVYHDYNLAGVAVVRCIMPILCLVNPGDAVLSFLNDEACRDH